MRSAHTEQVEMAPVLDASTAAVVGYVDYMVDAVAARLIGGDALRIAEAVRRRRIEAAAEDLFIERLLGLQVTPALGAAGQELRRRCGRPRRRGIVVAAVRHGDVAAPRRPSSTAPGLWLARIEL